MTGKTLFDKIWEAHVVVERDDGQTLLYIDRHLQVICFQLQCHPVWLPGYKKDITEI